MIRITHTITCFLCTGVMGPDEYHFNVNNSVFTNYNAKLSLQLPKYIVDAFNVYVVVFYFLS